MAITLFITRICRRILYAKYREYKRRKIEKISEIKPSNSEKLSKTLWAAADALRGSVSAFIYKDIVLGLIFLKYLTDSFEHKRREIQKHTEEMKLSADAAEAIVEDSQRYMADGVFYIPEEATWEAVCKKWRPAREYPASWTK